MNTQDSISIGEMSLAQQFMNLFAGLARAYGTYTISTTGAKGKRVGVGKEIQTERAPVTLRIWESHLSGKQGIGIVPTRDGDGVFGAIDIDQYNIDHRAVMVKLAKVNLPIVTCRSKSGGAHLFLFCASPVSAVKMRKRLSEIAAYLGYSGAEIFPKQDALVTDKGDVGAWINMPYFNGTMGMRYALKSSGDAYTAEEFVKLAESKRVSPKFFEERIVCDDAFEDGPPCLQILAQLGFPEGTRSDGLVNIGIYLKKSDPDGWETRLGSANQQYMSPPLTDVEVRDTAKSLKKKDYSYSCRKPLLAPHCNSALCRTRPYGVGSGGSGLAMPKLGDLTKLKTTPAIWFWTVDGQRLELTTGELFDSRAFSKACLEKLSLVVPMVSAINWLQILEQAKQKLVEIEAPPEASPEGQFWELLQQFCTGRVQALSLQEMALGKPYTDQAAKTTSFRMIDLGAFLKRHKFYELQTPDIVKVLQDRGGAHTSNRERTQGLSYWTIKAFEFDDGTKLDVPEELKNPEVPF